jgi:hypothetical protein
MTPTLSLENIGQIQKADLAFGDLTVLVGPQASGKSISLQWLKLVLDTGLVHAQLAQYGLDWNKNFSTFLDVYFGEGMRSLWNDGKSTVTWNAEPQEPTRIAGRKAKGKTESVFLIPAQRVVTLRDGWPRPFSDFAAGDPFAMRSYSEKLRLLMEQELGRSESVFPKPNRLKSEYRKLLDESIFRRYQLTIDKSRPQKRLVLGSAAGDDKLPYMVWSTGQREFVPLLLGLYWLMPPAKVSRRDDIEWVIIEEPEMGMHPRAITTLLLLVLELLNRHYRVCISTHSPQVLELVWALEVLKKNNANPEELLKLFEAKKSQELLKVARGALAKSCRVYYFENEPVIVHDITRLNPSSLDSKEATWGSMLDFSGRVNKAVATAMANQRPGTPKARPSISNTGDTVKENQGSLGFE